MSWLTNWKYRKSHVINAAADAGTDYQKRITAHFSAPHYQHSEIDDVSEYLRGAGEQFQRYSFYGCGLYWIFYCDDINIVYKTSSDGINWSTKTTIRVATQLYMFTILWDDPYIYYVIGGVSGDNKVYFRRGIPDVDGIITWTSAEVKVADYRATSPCLTKDSNGKIWLTQFKTTDLNVGTFEVIKNDAVDGSWSIASGYPLELSAGIGGRTQGSICALTEGKMYAAYGMVDENEENPSLVYGKLFNGENWGNEETISTENLALGGGVFITVDAKDDDVYITYCVEKIENKITITFNKRVYGVGWGSEEYISDDFPGLTNLGPVMTFNPDEDELWVIYGDPSVDLIYLRKRISGVWYDQETIYDFSEIQDTSHFILNAFRRSWDGHFAIQFDVAQGATNKIYWLHYVHDINEHVYLSENCQVDFEDIRFTDDDGDTFLDYWMQEKVDSDYAIFWVKVNDDLSADPQTIYIYYDNVAASYPIGDDQDEMDATFLFADHFYGSTLDAAKWDEINTPTINVADSICTVTSGSAAWKGISSDDIFGAYGIAWISRHQFSSGNRTIAGMSNTGIPVADDEMCFLSPTLPRSRVCDEGSYADIFFDIDDSFHIYDITWKAGQCKFYIDGILASTHIVDVPNEALKTWITSYNNSQTSDWVAIRKFVDPEPEHDIWGEEEEEILEFIGSVDSVSNVSGSLIKSLKLAASITPSSNVSGSLTIPVRFNGFIAANSNIVGSLSTLLIALNGSITPSSNVSGSFCLQSRLEGCLIVISNISGSLSFLSKIFNSNSVSISDVSASLSVTTELGSSIVEISGASASLGSLGVLTLLVAPTIGVSGLSGRLGFLISIEGSISSLSNVSGNLNSQPGCDGSIFGAFSVSGNLNINKEFYGLITGALETGGTLTTVYLNVERCLIGFVTSTSDLSGWLIPYFDGRNIIKPISLLSGSLNIIRQLEGISSIVSVNQGNINLLSILLGLLNESSNIYGIAHFVALGFYENLANQLSAYFQDIADVNNLIIRYDNDLRATPSDNLWCEYNIDFGNATQNNLGIDTFRNIGNFNIRIKNQIGLGIGELFEKADIISTAFLRKNLNRIIFDIPKIRKIGRVEDNYQVNVICPFFSDKIGK